MIFKYSVLLIIDTCILVCFVGFFNKNILHLPHINPNKSEFAAKFIFHSWMLNEDEMNENNCNNTAKSPPPKNIISSTCIWKNSDF